MYHRKAFGPQRRSSRQALARDIAASIVAAQQRGEHWPITFYTQQAETIRLVEEQLAAAARDSKPAQEDAAAPLTDAEQDCVREGDAMRIARYRNTRYWAVIDTEDTLVCLCVYRRVRWKSSDACRQGPQPNREAGPAGSAFFSLPFISIRS